MHRIFQKFIDLLSCGQDAGAFAEAIAITAKALDLSCFAYLALPPPGGATPLILSTYPADWVAHYLRKHYERLDPVITRALNNPEPFRWGLSLSPSALSPTQQHFFDEAAEFGIRAGFTVPS